eukprot:GHVS01077329.1.p1 GENE.GHVS01077329.1~~GHVS01077329.1.p1  ORF type:complete len:850 (-),score=93.44 GHVS01077329.1:336-2885(-)
MASGIRLPSSVTNNCSKCAEYSTAPSSLLPHYLHDHLLPSLQTLFGITSASSFAITQADLFDPPDTDGLEVNAILQQRTANGKRKSHLHSAHNLRRKEKEERCDAAFSTNPISAGAEMVNSDEYTIYMWNSSNDKHKPVTYKTKTTTITSRQRRRLPPNSCVVESASNDSGGVGSNDSGGGGSNDSGGVVELWDRFGVFFSLRVEGLHGKFWSSVDCCHLSPKAFSIVYIAESLHPSRGGHEVSRNLNRYLYRQSWGEQRAERFMGRMFIASVGQNNNVAAVQPLSREHSYGQVAWVDDNSIICTAFPETPQKLGVVYCINRSSSIYLVNTVDSSPSWTKISDDDDFAAWSPVFKKTVVFYLTLTKGDRGCRAHFGEVGVKVVGLRKEDDGLYVIENRKTLYTPLQPACELNPGYSGGLFVSTIGLWNRKTCGWPLIFLNTFFGPRERVVAMHVTTGEMREVRLGSLTSALESEFSTSCYSLTLRGMSWPYFLFERSTPLTHSVLILAELSERHKVEGVITDFDRCQPYVDVTAISSIGVDPLSNIDLPLLGLTLPPLMPFSPDDLGIRRSFENAASGLVAFTWRGRHVVIRQKVLPQFRMLLVVLHGGPHSCYSEGFNADSAFFALAGFDVLAINYRGSVGFSQEELLSIHGKIGTQDVEDVREAVISFISEFDIDRSRVAVIGGSHGGFLVLHLIGKYPNLFAAASCRNPVTNLLSMYGSSDIPDWCLAQACNRDYDCRDPYGCLDGSDDSQVRELYQRSPIRYAPTITTPLLMAVGLNDLRVPASQSKEYYNIANANGRTIRMLCYEDNDHRIDNDVCSEDYFLNTAVWFLQHLLKIAHSPVQPCA